MASTDHSRSVAKATAILSATEVGLGSALHALHIPLRGHVLSLNQGVVLTFAVKRAHTRREAATSATQVAAVSATLKSLSPAGNKLMPMVAILTQGLLFSVGIALLGLNAVGVAVGMVLSSAWAVVQPLITAYVVFGAVLFEAVWRIWTEFATSLHLDPALGLGAFIALATLKMVVGAVLGVLAWHASPAQEAKYQDRLAHWAQRGPRATPGHPLGPLRSALRDLLNPWLIGALSLSATFLVLSRSAGGIEIGLYAARSLAIAFLFLFATRAAPASWIARGLNRFPAVRLALNGLRHEPERAGPPR